MMAAVAACQRNHPLGPMDTRMNDDEYLEYMDEAIQKSNPKKDPAGNENGANSDPVGVRSTPDGDEETTDSSSSGGSESGKFKRVFRPPTGKLSYICFKHPWLISLLSFRCTK